MKKLLVLVLASLFLVSLYTFADDNGTGNNNDTGNRQESHTGKVTTWTATGIACVTAALTKRDAAILS